MPAPSPSLEVFCSYAHEDETYLRRLEVHLNLLQRQNLITLWHKRLLLPGTNWKRAIDARLKTASIILLLVSPDFLASDACHEVEMQHALHRHEANEARVVPIILRPCDWNHAPFAHLLSLPDDEKAIALWKNQDLAWNTVTAGLRRVIEDLSQMPTSAASATSAAIWMIPYPHNPFFLGRDHLLSHLRDQLQQGQPTALSQPQALSGLGGIGKTQLAVEYAHRFRQHYQTVLWARADTQEALVSSYVAIATALKLPQKDEQDQHIVVQAVKTWQQSAQGWLLILDNADELAIVPDFLPPSLGGHLLLTTRATALGRLAHRIEVETFSQEDGAFFLLRRAALLAPDLPLEHAAPEDQRAARQITQELGGLPLALDQAGAYLEETRCSIASYQQIYRQRRLDLLKKRGGLAKDHPLPVATTWSLSFQRVQERSAAAADLLRLCAFLAPDAIPEELFALGAEHLGEHLGPLVADPFLLNQAIRALRAYSLLSRDAHTKQLSVHRLVQAILKDQMHQPDQAQWAERTVRAIASAFPSVGHQMWPQCERLLPHALITAELIEQYHFQFSTAADLLNQTGLYLHERAQYQDAEPLYQRALIIREQQFGPHHPDTATSLNNLAELYRAQGRYDLALPFYQRALAIHEQQFGPHHPNTAISLNNLALFYDTQGHYDLALPLYQRALTIRELQLGPDHPDTALSLNNLAALYRTQGHYDLALPLYQRALAIREQLLGPDHPNTAISLNNLALFYDTQGHYDLALPLHLRALTIRELQLGPDHPDTARSLNNLALLYHDQGCYDLALPLLQRALAIHEQLLGPHHPNTVIIQSNYALLLQEMEQNEEEDKL